jgi:hypothetical protein
VPPTSILIVHRPKITPKYSKLDESEDVAETMTLSVTSSEDLGLKPLKLREQIPQYLRQNWSRPMLQRSMQAFGLALFALTFFTMGLVFRHFQGTDENSRLDTGWGKKSFVFELGSH